MSHYLNRKALDRLWQWSRHEMPETHDTVLLALFVVTTLRDRSEALTEEHISFLKMFESVMSDEPEAVES